MPTRYVLDSGFDQAVDAAVSIDGGVDPIIGAGIIIPQTQYGSQIDAVIPSVDNINLPSGAPTGYRITILTGQVNVIVGLAQGVSANFARYFNTSPNVGERKVSALAAFGRQYVALDMVRLNPVLAIDTQPLPLSYRVGGGIKLAPLNAGLVLATFYWDETAVTTVTDLPYIGLTVLGTPLTGAQSDSDKERTPARFNNITQPSALGT